jgi:2-polyprenyl-3-methyl-5-hydroxy-6-metoxy-1,4-benzoquinol methylase
MQTSFFVSKSVITEIDSSQVALAHDAMAHEYDQLDDLWYPWLFAQIHKFIANHLPSSKKPRPQTLDVGCGTGFQSFLLSLSGYEVLGFDISKELLRLAESKIPLYAVPPSESPPSESPPLFTSRSWSGVANHHKSLLSRLDKIRAGRSLIPPTFAYGDVTEFDFGVEKFDSIVCCGSVLSFVNSYELVVKRMAEGLCREGLLFLEVEQRFNLDLFWPILDNLVAGRLGYEQSWREILVNIFARPSISVRVDYPFELQTGGQIMLPIWLFSVKDLKRIFHECSLKVIDQLAIHWITNVIPSTILHKTNPGSLLLSLMNPLMYLDGRFGRFWPARQFGCSVVFVLRKESSGFKQ